jgi:hypothetical protein
MKSNNKLKSLAFNFNPFRIRNPVLYPLSYGGSLVSGRGLRISDGLLKFNKEIIYGKCGMRKIELRVTGCAVRGILLKCPLTRYPFPAPRNSHPVPRNIKHQKPNTILTYLYKFRKVVDNSGFFMLYL